MRHRQSAMHAGHHAHPAPVCRADAPSSAHPASGASRSKRSLCSRTGPRGQLRWPGTVHSAWRPRRPNCLRKSLPAPAEAPGVPGAAGRLARATLLHLLRRCSRLTSRGEPRPTLPPAPWSRPPGPLGSAWTSFSKCGQRECAGWSTTPPQAAVGGPPLTVSPPLPRLGQRWQGQTQVLFLSSFSSTSLHQLSREKDVANGFARRSSRPSHLRNMPSPPECIPLLLGFQRTQSATPYTAASFPASPASPSLAKLLPSRAAREASSPRPGPWASASSVLPSPTARSVSWLASEGAPPASHMVKFGHALDKPLHTKIPAK